MTIALIILAATFVLLLLVRVGGARRIELIRRWPAVVLAAAAIVALARGQVWFALGLLGAAGIAWALTPEQRAARAHTPNDPRDTEARALLGVAADASAGQIRSAYRARMARAHPDRGGSHDEAARLTAARDRLLKR